MLITTLLIYLSGFSTDIFQSIAFGNRQWLRDFRLGWLVQINDTTHFQKPWTGNLKLQYIGCPKLLEWVVTLICTSQLLNSNLKCLALCGVL